MEHAKFKMYIDTQVEILSKHLDTPAWISWMRSISVIHEVYLIQKATRLDEDENILKMKVD